MTPQPDSSSSASVPSLKHRSKSSLLCSSPSEARFWKSKTCDEEDVPADRRYTGPVRYLSKFLHNLSGMRRPPRSLTHK
ncbi:hypothetical protein pdam_00023083, partial [Pocillopora damicornis]